MKKKTHNQRAKAVVLILHNAQQQAVGLLLILTVLLSILYVYFLGTAVVHAVERKETQNNIAETHSRIADLEVNYLQGKDAITRDLASELGFRSVAAKDYVTRARYLGRADTQ